MIYSTDEWYELKDSIVPQMFFIEDDKVIYFDKMNKHEGRFYRHKKGEKDYFEIDNVIGLISQKGELYSIELGDNTIIRELDVKGNCNREFNLQGVFYDFTKDDNDNYIFIGIKESKFLIEIYNDKGKKISYFYPNNIILGCGINVVNDSIFIGTIDQNNTIRLVQMNYIGVVMKEWIITESNGEEVVDKILFYKNYGIILLKGESNRIVTLNLTDKSRRVISPENLCLSCFMDINIYGEYLYILDGRKIYRTYLDYITNYKMEFKAIKISINTNVMAYQYMMYFGEISRNLCITIKPILMAAIFFVFAYFSFIGDNQRSSFLMLNLLLISVCALSYAVIKSIFKLSDRGERIERLLEIDRDGASSSMLHGGIFAVLLFNIVCSFMPLKLGFIIWDFTLIFGAVYLLDYLCKRKVIGSKKEMIIELLSDDNPEYSKYIQFILSKMINDKKDKLLIKILAEDRSVKGVAANWAKTRGHILKQEIEVNVSEGKLTTYIDLSKRDIKYSKYSIIMDYICFVKARTKIKEIEINYTD